uniref:Uncharacterized protein n=1 Tax=Plectus sambesii TaxID=2011161 RepID=A0A914UTX0_9BILA
MYQQSYRMWNTWNVIYTMVKEESASQLNGDAEAGSLQSRSTNVLWKRK